MSTVALVEPGHSKLDYIKKQIANGFDRANKGGQEWIEGSLIMAAALREARSMIPANVTFSGWLKENKLDVVMHHDRAALISMAADLSVMRTLLGETESRAYQHIWRQNKGRFTQMSKTPAPTRTKRYHKPRTYTAGRAMNHRRMKLGDEVIDKIKDTSLDRADEMDELVRLNRGAAEGELTEDVRSLVARAVAGEDVSAIAYTEQHIPISKRKRPALVDMWRKRMVSAWEQADYDAQQKFLEYLIEHLKKKGGS